MSSIINKVKDALHSDKHETSTTETHPTGTTTHTSTTHPHNTTSTTHNNNNVPEGTAGPHSSRVANAADPTVDSDLDRNHAARNHATGTTGTGVTSATHGTHGTHGTHNTTHNNNNVPEGTAGPHSSRLANTADPTVDSDLDRNHAARNHATGTGTGVTGTTGTHNNTTGYDGTHGTHNTHNTTGGLTGSHATHGTTTGVPEGTYGKHNTATANRLDPTVDSDLDRTKGVNPTHGTTQNTTGSGLTGSHGTHGTTHNTAGSGLTGTHGTHGTTHNTATGYDGTQGTHNTTGGLTGNNATHGTTTGTHGTHNTTGSGLTGTHGTTGATGATGAGYGAEQNVGNPKSTNAGPHGSNIANVIDPRVDSDLNGSKTIGGNKTYTGGNNNVNTHDASKVTPSVMAAHHGEPIVAHDHAGANHAGRHGSVSHQEAHSGI